ncbi:hypothetical protein GCM10022205_13340 [Spinactinospora alkalitolerans]
MSAQEGAIGRRADAPPRHRIILGGSLAPFATDRRELRIARSDGRGRRRRRRWRTFPTASAALPEALPGTALEIVGHWAALWTIMLRKIPKKAAQPDAARIRCGRGRRRGTAGAPDANLWSPNARRTAERSAR